MNGGLRVVRRVDAATTLPLRAAVLRPGKDPSAVVKPGDDAPDTWFFAALTPDGSVLSTVNVRPGAPEFDPEGTGWWWLRGMATAPEARGRGHARAVVTAALGHVDGLGDGVWCNARVPAVGFYEKLGFERIGEQWTVPHTGPHVKMVRWPRGADSPA
jgi:GNAT superfamily N-acetyltransferase